MMDFARAAVMLRSCRDIGRRSSATFMSDHLRRGWRETLSLVYVSTFYSYYRNSVQYTRPLADGWKNLLDDDLHLRNRSEDVIWHIQEAPLILRVKNVGALLIVPSQNTLRVEVSVSSHGLDECWRRSVPLLAESKLEDQSP